MILIRHLRCRVRPLAALSGPSYSTLAASASAAALEAERTIRDGPRNDWSRDEIKSIYGSPILDLLFHGVRPPLSLYDSIIYVLLKCVRRTQLVVLSVVIPADKVGPLKCFV
ncbi:hypothetical protein B296_00050171 [Ensete ventricosum]|uniref:Uncharacterized protein n=1 Tax=Ensete ventricosum TaxID=4639 RepID=A0A426YMJ5_ENSVE|nr:hypothetical protein B296_00050171 [Ensete ventricosum]